MVEFPSYRELKQINHGLFFRENKTERSSRGQLCEIEIEFIKSMRGFKHLL